MKLERTEGWKEQAKELYESGMTVREVGEVFGCTGARVHQVLQRLDVDFRGQGCRGPQKLKFSPDSEQGKQVLEWYFGGMHLEEVADRLGCSVSTINSWREHHGIEQRRLIHRTPDELEKAILLDYEQGYLTVPVIAEMHEVSLMTVYRIVKRAGVPYRMPSVHEKLSGRKRK